MSLVMPSIFGSRPLSNRSMVLNLKTNSFSLFPVALYFSPHHKLRTIFTNKAHTVFRHKKVSTTLNSNATPESISEYYTEDADAASFEWGSEDSDETEDMNLPWEGSVIYKRNSAIPHVEYCTTLERLGFEYLSTETSKSRASAMGLRVTKAVKDFPFGTPVQISVDVTRRKKKLRLDGIVKTVITLGCNRRGEPAAESVYSNFSLLLIEEPVEEPDIIDMGTIYGENKSWTPGFGGEEDGEEDDVSSFDIDDILYFPLEQKEIDISKTIRDLVHLEITINAICDPSCKGLCLKCGTNLNSRSCSCSQGMEVEKKNFGPLGDLKKQMQQRETQRLHYNTVFLGQNGRSRLGVTTKNPAQNI